MKAIAFAMWLLLMVGHRASAQGCSVPDVTPPACEAEGLLEKFIPGLTKQRLDRCDQAMEELGRQQTACFQAQERARQEAWREQQKADEARRRAKEEEDKAQTQAAIVAADGVEMYVLEVNHNFPEMEEPCQPSRKPRSFGSHLDQAHIPYTVANIVNYWIEFIVYGPNSLVYAEFFFYNQQACLSFWLHDQQSIGSRFRVGRE